MKKRTILSVSLAVVAALATAAEAVEVYVNQVKVTGALQNLNLDNVKVQFDAKGDVRIDAPGYAIQTQGGTAPAAAPPTPPAVAGTAPAVGAAAGQLTKRYWLVVNVPQKGQYRINIKTNGQPLIDVPPTSPQYVTEVTGKLKPGQNSATVTFYPMPSAPAGSGEAVNVMIGEGAQGADGTLTISRVLGTAKMAAGVKSATATPLAFEAR